MQPAEEEEEGQGLQPGALHVGRRQGLLLPIKGAGVGGIREARQIHAVPDTCRGDGSVELPAEVPVCGRGGGPAGGSVGTGQGRGCSSGKVGW